MARPAHGPADLPHWQRNARAIAAGNVLINIGWSAAFAFLPLIVRGLGVERDLELWVGLIMFGYYGTSCVFTPIWGVLADHYGRRSMVLRAAFGMATGFSLLALTSDPIVFALVLIATGMANGFVPAGQALVATTTPGREVGRALALTQAGASTGNLAGPLIGAALIGVLPHAQFLYSFAGIATATAGLLVIFLVREHHRRPDRKLRIDLRGDVAQLRQVPGLRLLYFLQVLFAFTVFGAVPIVTLFTLELLGPLTHYAGIPVETWVALMAIGFTATGIVVLPLWGRMLDRQSAARVLAVLLAGLLLTSLLQPLVTDPFQLLVARVLFAVFVSGLPPVLIRMIRDLAPPGMEARTLSYGTALQQVGSAVAPLLAGLLAPWLGMRGYFGVSALLVAVGWAMWRRIGRPEWEARHGC